VNEAAGAPQSASRFSGIIPILAMPFTAGGIDEESLAREVGWAIEAGVDGLGLALASELPRLSAQEREQVIQLVVAETRARVPVVIAASAESAVGATRLAQEAEESGAAAVMIHPPTFEASSSRAQLAFFDDILARTSLPIFIQDLPQARLDLGVAVALEQAHPGRIALKEECPPTVDTIAGAIEFTQGRLPVFGGAGGLLFYSELLRGAAGTMPGCVFPDVFVQVWRQFNAGDAGAARVTFARIVAFLNATNRPGLMFSFYREALVLRGIFPQAIARTPGIALDPTDRRELRELLEDIDVLDLTA
jgi:dihydrodipicolinate synthase/N-acetylneuraminate lyase